MILVTSANGKTGRAVIAALTERGVPVRAMTASAASAVQLRDLGLTDVVVGDLREQADIAAACEGAIAVYYITPNFSADEPVMTDNLIAACRRAAEVRIVLHSVIHPQIQALTHHWSRLGVEEKLINAKLPWSILQPTSYMQNVAPQFAAIRETRLLKAPMPVDRTLSLVDLADVAEVAAAALVDPSYDFGIYELGGAPITLAEQADIIGRLVDASITPQALDPAAVGGELGIPFADDHGRETMQRMYDHYAAHGLRGNTKVLRFLLGREPADYEMFARRELGRLGLLKD